jgi:hypothetical protein
VPLSGHLEALSNEYWGQAWLQRKMSFHGLRSGIRQRSPRLARRHPNGESEGIWMAQLPWWRPDLRRDMSGIPKISDPQERERNVEYNAQRECLHHRVGAPQSLVGNPVPGVRASCDLALGFWGNGRERPQLRIQRGLTEGERTLREDWPVVDGGWRHAGVEELPCELVREWHFLGSGILVRQLRSQRKARRARSVLGTQPDPSHGTKC